MSEYRAFKTFVRENRSGQQNIEVKPSRPEQREPYIKTGSESTYSGIKSRMRKGRDCDYGNHFFVDSCLT